MSTRAGRWAAIGSAAAGIVVGLAAPAWARQDSSAVPDPAPYFRVVEENDGAKVSLQMAVREFAPPDPDKPRLYIASAMHIGENSFYHELQQFLDQQDVVLFEGVKPPGAGAPEHDAASETDEQKAASTRRRVRFIAMAVERYRAGHDGHLPADFDELQHKSEGRVASLLNGALVDAWGRPLRYTVEQAGLGRADLEQAKDHPKTAPEAPNADPEEGLPTGNFDVVSLGADGRPGGEGPAADIKYSDQKPLSKPEKGDRSKGIQQQLADALGLVFQLTAMDNNKPNWRNSDLSVDQVQARLEKAGANADALFSMLDGSSFMGQIAGAVVRFMGSTPESRAMLKIMLIETLAHSDEALAGAPGKMGRMMSVLIQDRNAVVIDDLKKVVATEPNVKSVAIIYGGGHLPSMQKRIETELGYRPVGDTWRTAMSVDARDSGLSAERLRRMREMFDRTFERQAKAAAARRAAEQRKPAPPGDTDPSDPGGK